MMTNHTSSSIILVATAIICCLAAPSHGEEATFVLFGHEDKEERLRKTPLSQEAFRSLDPLSTDEITYAEKVCTEEGLVYAHPTTKTLKEGTAFSWRGGRFFCLFAENPISSFEKQGLLAGGLSDEDKAKFRLIVKQVVDIKAALWVYSADAALDLKKKLSTPLAILEIVSTPAAEGRVELDASGAEAGYSFVIYVAAGRLSFGTVPDVSDKMAAIRFFADFLSANPGKEFICLGSAEEGVAYFRKRLEVCDDAEALLALDEQMRKTSAARLASQAAPKRDFTITSAPLDAERFSQPNMRSELVKVSDKTILRDKASFRTFKPEDVSTVRYAHAMASFPTVDYGVLSKGVWFMLHDASLVAVFIDHPPVQRDEERLRRTNFSYEAALYLYPMDPVLTHRMSPARSKGEPLAVLTLETSNSSPDSFFCAFTPDAHLNFGICKRPETPQDAARFFFEFLCEHPEEDVFCLGKEYSDDSCRIRECRERMAFDIIGKARDENRDRPATSDIVKELRPTLEKVKADAPALAEKYNMVLWPVGRGKAKDEKANASR